MLGPIDISDLPEIRQVIDLAVRQCVVDSDDHADFLISMIEESLVKWTDSMDNSVHLKFCDSGEIAGFVIVKEYWNLSHLFVRPACQNLGIGRQLIEEALQVCRKHSTRGAVELNSSNYAVAFYEEMGFTQTGPGEQKIGGCIPFEYQFPA
jgi:ribosomal protein S18 acetylase RimI-like enzyme